MKPLTVSYVDASTLFQGQRHIWDELSESEPEFTWGSNSYSLISKSTLLNQLDNLDIDTEVIETRLKELPDYVYINLEG